MAPGKRQPPFTDEPPETAAMTRHPQKPLASILDLSAYTGRVFEFYNLTSDSGVDDFYINTMNVSAVPIPAALFLFAPALLGFIGLRRRTNSAVA